MATAEARVVYDGIEAMAYELPALRDVEDQAKDAAPVVVVFYESFLQRDQAVLYGYLRSNYALVQELPGRVSPTRIYRRSH